METAVLAIGEGWKYRNGNTSWARAYIIWEPNSTPNHPSVGFLYQIQPCSEGTMLLPDSIYQREGGSTTFTLTPDLDRSMVTEEFSTLIREAEDTLGNLSFQPVEPVDVTTGVLPCS
jgi:hypothetical protein